ncbi:hypothetical protein B0H17DRAFT_1220175 [Mycena rosella]|uniref:Uncharacterized protein n=1 Tax=Mycena rosella TaxID=1033263 RepID=A0AAD7BC37_MYCRO|nr:hypothetical protein B0H17DRAFT_1220175 [Mycena rosella]
MDTIASHRFLASNVVWPADKFFIPHGGLLRFLHDNLRFKVFLVMSALFTNAYVSTAVPTLTTSQRQEIRYRMRDIVRHMFFAAQIRQNEFRVAYCTIPVPPQSAWTFHVILAMLRVVGFEGDGDVVAAALAMCARDEQCDIPVTFDYADYDTDGLVTQFFYRRRRPTQLHPIPVFDPSEEDYALADLAMTWGRSAPRGLHGSRRPWMRRSRELLLQPANLGNPDWMPNIPIAESLRKRVRPVAYFLQRSTCEEWGFVGPMVELPQEEAEDV